MITFKQYLKEGPPKWTESLSTMLFDLPRAGLKDVLIPLSPAILKRIWPKPPRTTVFHLTDYTGVGKLKGLQGKQKSISAFFNITPRAIEYGVATEGGYVVELIGDILAAAPDDLSTRPDKTGRRWLAFSTLVNPIDFGHFGDGIGGGAKLKGMENDISEMMIEIIMEYADDPSDFLPNTNEAWMSLGLYSSPKEKSLIIKDYMDGMEKIMKKHSKPLRSVLTDYTKKKTLEPDPDSGETAMWDELVVNNFTIQMIHIGPEMSPDFDPENEDSLGKEDLGGFDYLLYDDAGDMIDYINRALI